MASKPAATAGGAGGGDNNRNSNSNSSSVGASAGGGVSGGLGTPPSTAVPSRLASSMTNPFEQPPASSSMDDDGGMAAAAARSTRGERANSLADPPPTTNHHQHAHAVRTGTTASTTNAAAFTAGGDNERGAAVAAASSNTAAAGAVSAHVATSSTLSVGPLVAAASVTAAPASSTAIIAATATAATSTTTMADNTNNIQQQQQQHQASSNPQNHNAISSTSANNPNNNNPSTTSTTTTNPNNTTTAAAETISYSAERIIGNGSFGVVFQASVYETGEVVAIKKVLQDKRFKNRELQIMRLLVKDGHSNIVALKHCFYSQGEKQDELYLNLVLEYVPETVYSISRQHQKSKISLPLLYVKLYLYQLSRALSHIHALGICHRDIKPQNLLVNPENQQLKLCDFGSAKALVRGEPNVSYICSRYYRAPELIFGSTDYSTAIDIWSEGCVGAELLLGQPLFPGDSGVDQLVEIIKVLGTPTREEISSMNSNYTEFKFPQIKACQWRKVFRSKTPEVAMDFIGSTLAYDPEKRIKPLEGCGHPFFDELREERTRLPNGNALPPLFDFTHHELASSPELLAKLIPPHVKIDRSAIIDHGDSKPTAT
ncbi:hypothetical protein ACHAWU_009483 [Discostella pseudostelligera]|uniref:Protein kinase domain-containing protein n=1 Tax=Discostella pseudostelligera TaxID=259834 RepID=A0ABD3M0W5_9STRA